MYLSDFIKRSFYGVIVCQGNRLFKNGLKCKQDNTHLRNLVYADSDRCTAYCAGLPPSGGATSTSSVGVVSEFLAF